MRLRALITGAVAGAVFGALVTLLAGTGTLPPLVNRLTMPGVALLWGTSLGWGAVVAVNAAVYAGVGLLLGVLVAGGRTRATHTLNDQGHR